MASKTSGGFTVRAESFFAFLEVNRDVDPVTVKVTQVDSSTLPRLTKQMATLLKDVIKLIEPAEGLFSDKKKVATLASKSGFRITMAPCSNDNLRLAFHKPIDLDKVTKD